LYSFLNGKIVEKEASLSLDDAGVLRGYGVFQVVRVYDGNPFLLKEHLQKLERDAHKLGIGFFKLPENIEDVIDELAEKNGLTDFYLRMVVTGGKLRKSFYPEGKANFFILAEKISELPEKLYSEGVHLISLNHKREFSKMKVINYARPISERSKLAESDAFDFLYTWNGNILESSRANFFIVKDEKIITPEKGVLPGITAKTVLGVAEDLGFTTEKREIEYQELRDADEAFLTSTVKEILPVKSIDDIEMKEIKIVKKLHKAYRELV